MHFVVLQGFFALGLRGYGHFVPWTFRSKNKKLFRSVIGQKNKFLVRSEVTSYTWNEMTIERNDRIPVKACESSPTPQCCLQCVHSTHQIFHCSTKREAQRDNWRHYFKICHCIRRRIWISNQLLTFSPAKKNQIFSSMVHLVARARSLGTRLESSPLLHILTLCQQEAWWRVGCGGSRLFAVFFY